MSNVFSGLGNWLLYSSVLLLMMTILIQLMRKALISLGYSRTVILKLWLALPLSLLVLFMTTALMVSHHYIEPLTLNLPAHIQTLSNAASFYFDWELVLLLVWFAISVSKMADLIHQYISTQKAVFKHTVLLYDNVFLTDLNISPMAFGLVRPKIIIPRSLQQELNSAELKLVLLHESIHCQRADPLWRFALATLNNIYWFLPWQRFNQEMLIQDQEYACDEQVIQKSQQLPVYAQLLLSLNIKRDYQSRRVINETILCAASFNLKERIMKLNEAKSKKYQAGLISVFLLLVFAISSFSAMAQVVAENNEDIVITPTHRAAPMYPFTAVKEKISGQVTVEFTITQDGHVINAKAIHSTPAEIFDKAAVKAIEQWTFEPIEKATQARQVIEFELGDE
jgi:TonB family protein